MIDEAVTGLGELSCSGWSPSLVFLLHRDAVAVAVRCEGADQAGDSLGGESSVTAHVSEGGAKGEAEGVKLPGACVRRSTS